MTSIFSLVQKKSNIAHLFFNINSEFIDVFVSSIHTLIIKEKDKTRSIFVVKNDSESTLRHASKFFKRNSSTIIVYADDSALISKVSSFRLQKQDIFIAFKLNLFDFESINDVLSSFENLIQIRRELVKIKNQLAKVKN